MNRLFAAAPSYFFGAWLLAIPVANAQMETFVAPGEAPQPVKFDLGGAAAGGPSVDADGNVYFSLTQLGTKTGTIQRWDCDTGSVTKIKGVDGGAIGTAIDLKGNLLVGEWANERITVDDLKGHQAVLVDSIDGRKLLDPNAIVVDSRGGIYFSESAEGSNSDTKNSADMNEGSGIDYIAPTANSAHRVAKLDGARKIILSPDGNTLISSGAGNKLWQFKVASDGALGDQKEFCSAKCANPVAFDEKGNAYLLGDQLLVYNMDGQQLAAIPMPKRFSNATFASADRKTLFMTGHDGIYTLRMTVRGAPSSLEYAQRKK